MKEVAIVSMVSENGTNISMISGFELKLQPVHGDGDAQAWVSWCLSPGLSTALQENPHLDAYVIISVVDRVSYYSEEIYADNLGGCIQSHNEARRYVVPLKQGRSLVAFTKPGEQVVLAAIYQAAHERVSQRLVYKEVVDKGRDLAKDIVRPLGKMLSLVEGWTDSDGKQLLNRIGQHDSASIMVDDRFFAKEPRMFVKQYLEKFPWARGSRDQCELRRQKLWAYPLLPVFLFARVFLLGILAIFIRYIIGFRWMRLGPLWHPFSMDVDDMEYVPHPTFFRSSMWLYKKPRNELTVNPEPQAWPLWAVNPMTIMVAFALAGLFSTSVSQWLQVGAGLLAVALLLGACFAAWRVLKKSAISKLEEHVEEESPDLTEEQLERLRERARSEYAPLLCGSSQEVKPTARVRFLDAKSRVCRPFAR